MGRLIANVDDAEAREGVGSGVVSTAHIAHAAHVVPPLRQRLVRRSLGTMQGSVVARRYRITDTLGAGGMGSVYEAKDLQTGCEVALKALQPGAYDPLRLKRLRREAKTMTAIQSPHVCKVHYLGVERGTPFIVMERLRGETLRTRLKEDGPMPAGEAVHVFCQLLDALTATHEAGIIHRDVKPSNVFLVPDPDAPDERPLLKLIDFGLAKVVRPANPPSARPPGSRTSSSSANVAVSERAIEEELSSAEAVAGTLHFLAPEQLMSLSDLDERVDVYAAGVTFYEMLAGRRPHRGSYSEVIHEIMYGETPRITKVRPDLPPDFDDIMAMAMARSRERRFSSAQAFKRALLAAWENWLGDPNPRPHGAAFQSGVCATATASANSESVADGSGSVAFVTDFGEAHGEQPANSWRERLDARSLAGDRTMSEIPGPLMFASRLDGFDAPEITMLEDELPTLRPPPMISPLPLDRGEVELERLTIPAPAPTVRTLDLNDNDDDDDDVPTVRPPPFPPRMS